MNDVMLNGAEPREILLTVIEKKIPAVMSYLSKGKWHAMKVMVTELGANKFDITVSPRKKPHPINIQIDQPVGISLKYGYGKFIFETKVVALGPSSDANGGGVMSLAVPDRIEIVQRRSYFRINVPDSLKVKVTIWHRNHMNSDQGQTPPERYWQGRLVDISAGGAGISVDSSQNPDFKKGQFVGFRFTPMPYEKPLVLNAQIRNVLPTVDDSGVCLGMQLVGLEASPEGRAVLQQLCDIVEKYYRLSQSGAKQQDMHTVNS